MKTLSPWADNVLATARKLRSVKEREIVPMIFGLRGDKREILMADLLSNNPAERERLAELFVRQFDPDEYLILEDADFIAGNTSDGESTALAQLVALGVLAIADLPSSRRAIVFVFSTRHEEVWGFDEYQWVGDEIRFSPRAFVEEATAMRGLYTRLRTRRAIDENRKN